MAFVKGQSGNPGGRPKSVEGQNLKELARSYTSDALDTLTAIMGNEKAPEAARVSAANSILDRGWGKPVQQIGDGDGNAVDLIAILMERRERKFDPHTDGVVDGIWVPNVNG